MAETQIYINDNYTADTSTKTVVQYVELTIEAAKSDIIQDIRPEIDNLVDESLSEKMGRYSLTNHTHTEYALVSETYSKLEVDLKVETSIPDLSPYATKDELQNYSIVSHTHDYALSSDTYSKQEVNDIVNSHVPDLSDYATKEELQNYSSVSHQHSDYALAENVYTKSETENLVNSHTPDLTDYYTKSETENLVNSHTPDLSSYYTKSETDNLISGFKRITFLTTDEYEALDPKDESVLYILTDSEETPIDLSSYVTIEQLNARGYKKIEYITTEAYEALDPKDESVLYVLTDSEEETIDLTNFYTKSETDTLISGFKNIQYISTADYEALDPKDESVLYVLTDSQEETIDLSSYVTKDELNAKGYKAITYITTSEYESLDPKSPDVLYILTDSLEPTIDLSQYSLTSHLHADYVLNSSLSDNYYDKIHIDSSLADFSLTSHLHADYVLNSSLSDNYYDKENTYSKDEVDSALSDKQNALSHYEEDGDDFRIGTLRGSINPRIFSDDSYNLNVGLDVNDGHMCEIIFNYDSDNNTNTMTFNSDVVEAQGAYANASIGEYWIRMQADDSHGGDHFIMKLEDKVGAVFGHETGFCQTFLKTNFTIYDEGGNDFIYGEGERGSANGSNLDIRATHFSWNGYTVVTTDELRSTISSLETLIDSSISALESTLGDIQTILASI